MYDLRLATLKDLDELALLFDAYRVFYQKPSDIEAARAFLQARIENNESTIFIAKDDNCIHFFLLHASNVCGF
jgi:hypothetical protein